MEDGVHFLQKQYLIAVEAKHKLKDNYHQWMTFYYVANSAILIALSYLYKSNTTEPGILLLALIGTLVCMLWNLACKAYLYHAQHWRFVVNRLERALILGNDEFSVFSKFTTEVEKENSYWNPLRISYRLNKDCLIYKMISFSYII